jgi:branched-chain amino acid transport system substrate-binding protein
MKRWWWGCLRLALLLPLALGLAGCAPRAPVLIGMAVELTGRRSEVGVAARNGAELAVEVVNANGGVNGRPLKLLVEDDQGDPETARQVDQKLAQAGVTAIIGHITSGQTAAVLELVNSLGVVLISPASSSSEFTGLDDYFFRLAPSNEQLAASLARHMVSNRGLYQAAAVYDLANRSFTETWYTHFAKELQALGGECLGLPYTSGEADLRQVAQQLKELAPQAVVLIASAVDAALLLQYADQEGLQAPFFATSWAQTSELIEKGGRLVNGLELSSTFVPNTDSSAYTQFAQAYQAHYGSQPVLGASHAYETVLVLRQALEQTRGQAEGLPEALRGIQDFPGLLGEISIDAYGDVQRDLYIVRVENGEYILISVVSLTK